MKKIKIAGITYTISEVANIGKDKNGYDIDGIVKIDEQKIELARNNHAGKEYKELVLIHEIVHLLFFYSGIGNNKLWKNEKDVNNFAVILRQFLHEKM